VSKPQQDVIAALRVRNEELEKALRGLVRVVSSQLARGEETTPGEFEAAWAAACAALKEKP
jgi:hypothetical protein